ncbi:Nucleotide binding protein PINc [Ignisphaera aggregans DSM 17230]|uniref:Endoribonuclease Nob1 n=1 Tax=Ignisphaera aggregans (strain DSM 17230 / JCM 13409 / AQ1.S1) TaxID=583356 RepID=E0SPP0_IGNAA|nr:Nucleotide binding protein PINc [Ignisphaera aggregans DSM 17230]
MSRSICNKVLVLDTAAFLAALPLHIYGYKMYTTPSVINEVRDSESVTRLEISIDIDRIEIVSPSTRSISRAVEISKRLGLYNLLSKTDIEVIALALELREQGLKPVVLTDDYDIQILLRSIGIEFRSVKTMGIKD